MAETKEPTTTGTKHSNTAWFVVIGIALGVLVVFGGFQQWNISRKNMQISMLTDEKTAVLTERDMLNKSLTDMTTTIDEVATKLQDIRQNQVSISDLLARTGSESSPKEKMLSDITAIQTQLDRDKSDINDLTAKMEQSNIRIKSLENLVAQLRSEVDQNEQTVAELRSIIENKNQVIQTTQTNLQNTENTLQMVRGDLSTTSLALQTTKSELEDARNSAWYVIGTKGDLKDQNVIDEHGFLIGKTLNLSGDLNEAAFTKIDIIQMNQLTIDSDMDDVKMVPERSESSYTLEEVGDNQTILRVTDPDKFWTIKYMAIVVKG